MIKDCLRGRDRSRRACDRLLSCYRTKGGADWDNHEICQLRRDIFGQFEMNGPRPLSLGHAKGIADERRDVAGVNDLFRGFREWPHHGDRVDNLKLRLPALVDRLLAGNHQHWHATKGGMGRRSHEVGCAGPERAEGKPPVSPLASHKSPP